MREHSFAKKQLGLAFLAIALCACVGVGVSYAYYTDTANAKGSLALSIDDPKTTVEERHDPEPDGTNKIISIESHSDVPVMVRMKLHFAERNADVQLQAERSADWAISDGWIYYTKPLQNGEVTSELKALVTVADGLEKEKTQFDLTVEQQTVEAYMEDGAYMGKFMGTPINVSALGTVDIPSIGSDQGYPISGWSAVSGADDKQNTETEGN